MARAAEKMPIDGEVNEEEKMEDSDSHIHSTHETRTEDAQISSPPNLRLPPDRLHTGPSTYLNPKPVSNAAADLAKPLPDSGSAVRVSGSTDTALARAHWDASDLWGAQSHGEPKKACAMCAQHLE